jgi:hypothetical protein
MGLDQPSVVDQPQAVLRIGDAARVAEEERREHGLSIQEQQELRLLTERVHTLSMAIQTHESLCRDKWNPFVDEQLWQHLPEQPTFPWASLQGSDDYYMSYYAEQRAVFAPSIVTNCKPHAPEAHFDIPEMEPLEYDDPRDHKRDRLVRLRRHLQYLEQIIRDHAARTAKRPSWENNAILHRLSHLLKQENINDHKPSFDQCMMEASRYRRAIEDLILKRPEGVPLMIPCPAKMAAHNLAEAPAYCHNEGSTASDAIIQNALCRLHACVRALSGDQRHEGVPNVPAEEELPLISLGVLAHEVASAEGA